MQRGGGRGSAGGSGGTGGGGGGGGGAGSRTGRSAEPGAQPAGGVTFEEEEPDYAGLGIGADAQFFSLP